MRILFEIGDRWDDGHGKYDSIYVDTNKTNEQLEAGYLAAKKVTDIDFSKICANYEDSSLPDYIIEALDDFGIKYDDLVGYGYEGSGEEHIAFFEESAGYIDLILRFIKFAIPDLEYNILVDDGVPRFNDRLLGGYGLFI